MTTQTKPTLLKQLMGGVIGATLAVGLYYGYEYASPKLSAYLITPERYPNFYAQQEANIVSNSLPDDRRDRINATVRKALQPTVTKTTTDTDLRSGAPIVTSGFKPYIPPVYQPPRAQVTKLPPLPPERIIHEEITTTVTEKITHTPALADSGFPIALLGFSTGGALLGMRKRKRQ